MSLLVLYRIEEIRNGEWWCDDSFNAFEAPLKVGSDRALLFGDLQSYILNNKILFSALGARHAFFAEVMNELIPLTSPGHVLPVADNGTLRLRLRPSVGVSIGCPPFLMQQSTEKSLSVLSYHLAREFPTSFVRNNRTVRPNTAPRSAPIQKTPSASFASKAEQENANNRDEYVQPRDEHPRNPRANAGGITSLVGDDAATALNDAAEVAKEAAKSLFGFAATWGKTVLDAASTVSTTAMGSSTCRLSGSITLGKMKVQVMRELSEGGFGIVYIAQDGSRSYALKQLICQSKSQLDEARSEIENLTILRGHPNIIELIDHGSATPPNQPRQFYLLFPLYPVGTAWEAIERASIGIDPASRTGPPWPFPEKRAIRVILCIAKALDFMHRKGLSHRDVKPHNILLSDESDDKHVLMDFGSVSPAKQSINSRSDALLVEDEAAQKTTMAYRPPELTSAPFPPCTLDERIDVWSLGCTMFCLAFGRSPFETAKEGVQKLAILNGRWSPPQDLRMRDCIFSSSYVGLIDRMLHLDWNSRPFMGEVIDRLQEML